MGPNSLIVVCVNSLEYGSCLGTSYAPLILECSHDAEVLLEWCHFLFFISHTALSEAVLGAQSYALNPKPRVGSFSA